MIKETFLLEAFPDITIIYIRKIVFSSSSKLPLLASCQEVLLTKGCFDINIAIICQERIEIFFLARQFLGEQHCTWSVVLVE